MFFIFTKGPFGSLWRIRTEVARAYIPTMNRAEEEEKNEETNGCQNRIVAVLTASC